MFAGSALKTEDLRDTEGRAVYQQQSPPVNISNSAGPSVCSSRRVSENEGVLKRSGNPHFQGLSVA